MVVRSSCNRSIAALALRIAAAALVTADPASATPGARPQDAVADARQALTLLAELAAIPSESSDAAGVKRAAGWLEARFRDLGFTVRALEGSSPGNPLVFAERVPRPGPARGRAAATVLFYLHYDTQPTGPPGDWDSTGGEPFVPRLLSGRWDERGTRPLAIGEIDSGSLEGARLYARGAADDKAPIVMHLMALRRWVGRPEAERLHLKFLLDGAEEAGSPGIGEALARHRAALSADLLILCDGPMDALGRRAIYLGTRGDMHMLLTLRTATRSGHSGNYGLLPDAAWRLASLLGTMKDSQGRVAVEGFLDDVVPPTAAERESLERASLAEPGIMEQFGVERFEGSPSVPYYERLLFAPGFIVNELKAGRPGNQVPVEAQALLEVRLVTKQDPRKVHEAFRRHVERHEPAARLELVDGTPAGRMDPSDPAVARGVAAARAAAGSDLLVYPSLGGTLPLLHDFASAGHRYIGLPLVNFDNNQHVANENLRVGVLPEGIAFLERLYEALAAP